MIPFPYLHSLHVILTDWSCSGSHSNDIRISGLNPLSSIWATIWWCGRWWMNCLLMFSMAGKSVFLIGFCWTYAIGWSLPPFFGWGRYIPEGILDSCSFDYLTRDFSVLSFYQFFLSIVNRWMDLRLKQLSHRPNQWNQIKKKKWLFLM